MNIFITGCSSGIGLATAKLLKEKGHRVLGSARKPIDEARLIEMGIEPIHLDLNDSFSVQQAVKSLEEKTSRKLDVLVNNAGFAIPGAVEDLSRDNLRLQFETNVFGLQELTNAVIPWMREQGHGKIINVSSVLGFVAMPFRGAYCASKFALEALTKALRMELASSHIQVVLIQPGQIKTAFRENARKAYESFLHVQKSPFKNDYEAMLTAIEKNKKESSFALPPEAIAQKIASAIESKNPKTNYYATLPVYLIMVLNRLLPNRWIEKLLIKTSQKEIGKKQ